eukprot:7084519-Lingulodinium_polyedra.AAC.1
MPCSCQHQFARGQDEAQARARLDKARRLALKMVASGPCFKRLLHPLASVTDCLTFGVIWRDRRGADGLSRVRRAALAANV